jgi:class 3 adenylate cyclase
MTSEVHYRWEWDLRSDPETFWPFISDTDRLNRDSGLPVVQSLVPRGQRLENARRRLRVRLYGVPLDYEETPFEWVRPYRYGVQRRYLPHPLNPLAEFRMLAELAPRPDGGTHLTYQVWVKPRNVLGTIAIPIQIGILNKRQIEKSLRRYEAIAVRRGTRLDLGAFVQFTSGGRERLTAARDQLAAQGNDPALLDRLVHVIETADDNSVARLRPYALADQWGAPRQRVLELCLRATRASLLDFQWELLCPNCRGAAEQVVALSNVTRTVHCDTCNIDFKANFERSVELMFRPNAAIRAVEVTPFCVAGPQTTPHVVIQQMLAAGETRAIRTALETGRYRLRAIELDGSQSLVVVPDGPSEITLRADSQWPVEEPQAAPQATLHLENATAREQLLILERTSWSDQAATAADVTALQVFRDLFANEALRPGEQISVGSLTILFTDLRGSTRLYREIGDAPAFGLVMSHFDVLKEAIAAEGGAIVKNIGDAIMAVFRQPAGSIRAIIRAQRTLAMPPNNTRPLMLKVGIHSGPCIAVNFNDRLDYFGSTINAAARLVELSNGEDVIISGSLRRDPEISALLADPANGLAAVQNETTLKGFDEEKFEIWRVRPNG